LASRIEFAEAEKDRRQSEIFDAVDLDDERPNRFFLASGLGKLTRNELFAEYYLRAAGVAAVWIDERGHGGARDVASIENEPDCLVYCCERVLAYRLYEWKKAVEADQAAIAAKLEEIADLGGVGVTPRQIAVDRDLEAVTAVNETIAQMGSTGGLKALNRAFKEARKVAPTIRYFDSTPGRRRCSRLWRPSDESRNVLVTGKLDVCPSIEIGT
jgi:hypothetical protein